VLKELGGARRVQQETNGAESTRAAKKVETTGYGINSNNVGDSQVNQGGSEIAWGLSP
jgi:hypothetical protein